MLGRSAILLAGLTLLGAPDATNGQSAAPRLELPVDCQVGKTCFVQQYFDHDPGPAARDYRCGPKAYQGHDGTDFRLPTRAAMTAGVNVQAAAAGQVKSVRNDAPDHRGSAADMATVKGVECGNGVVIAHPGYETQYCHMARGSVIVRPGQSVTSGAVLGRVGQSGLAEFPHLHLSLRVGGEEVDPFAPGSPAACGKGGPGLWSRTAQAALTYRSPEVINAGFAAAPVTPEAVEAGPIAVPSAASPALLAYVRAIGLEAGDAQALRVTGPGGALFAEGSGPVLRVPRAQQVLFSGKRNSVGRFASGAYKARYTVTRAGRIVLDHSFELRI